MSDYNLSENVELAKKAKLELLGLFTGLDLRNILTIKQYSVFYLKHKKQLPNSEISKILGISESTVRVHNHNALIKIEMNMPVKDLPPYFNGIIKALTIKNALTPKQYIVFYLKFVKKLKYPAIADILGLKESTVRVHKHNILKKTKIIQNKT